MESTNDDDDDRTTTLPKKPTAERPNTDANDDDANPPAETIRPRRPSGAIARPRPCIAPDRPTSCEGGSR